MARPRRTIPCIHPRRTGSLSVSISEISQTPPSSPEPSHYGIQRAAAKSSQTENWPRQPQRNQSEFPRLKLERGAPQRDPPWRPGASRKAFQPTSTTLITNTMPCQIMVRCPLSRKWWSRILSRTSQASKRTPASANLSVQPSRPSWLIQSAPKRQPFKLRQPLIFPLPRLKTSLLLAWLPL